jgi:hypothetical protein
MMRHLHLATLISALMASVASAQNQQSVPRAIPLPDTLGANFAVTDTLTGTSEPADYDFLVGTWRFTFQARPLGVRPEANGRPGCADRGSLAAG